MRAAELAELAAFASVASHRSFRRAAEERGVTASAISHSVQKLEQRVGLRLLNRTTRSVSLTDAGELLRAQLDPAFAQIGHAVDSLNRFRETPFGKVRINVPSSIAPFILGGIIGPLIKDNPHLQLEVVATDRLIDIVAEGFDAGIRLGESISEGMIAVRIKPRLRLLVVGAPAYFENRDPPAHPRDLEKHVCISNIYPSGTRYAWEFERNGETVSFMPNGQVALDDHELIAQTVASGLGLGYIWEGRAQPYIDRGDLVCCLDDWCALEDWLYLYYPSRSYMSAGFRAVIDAMKIPVDQPSVKAATRKAAVMT